MIDMKHARFRLCLAAALLASVPLAAMGQGYPLKPITFVSSFAPGPGPDLYLRPLMGKLSQQLGQPIIMETRAGAGGAIAWQYVTRAAPDGYTLSMTTNSTLIQKYVEPDVGFDSLEQFAHITRLTLNGSVLVVPASSALMRLEDIIAAAKASPGKLNYGSGGSGTPSHLASASLQAIAGFDAVHIPYKSTEVVQALVRGDLQFSFQVVSFVGPLIRAGKLRALAVTSGTRMHQFPGVPTLNELLKNNLLVQESWLGLAFPARTPAALVQRMNAETLKALNDPMVQKGAENSGNNLVPTRTPEEYVAFIRRENEKYRDVVRLSGLGPR